MRVVVLGAGFGGLELTTRLSEEFGDTAEIVLIDATDTFVMGAAKLARIGRRRSPVLHARRSICRERSTGSFRRRPRCGRRHLTAVQMPTSAK